MNVPRVTDPTLHGELHLGQISKRLIKQDLKTIYFGSKCRAGCCDPEADVAVDPEFGNEQSSSM